MRAASKSFITAEAPFGWHLEEVHAEPAPRQLLDGLEHLGEYRSRVPADPHASSISRMKTGTPRADGANGIGGRNHGLADLLEQRELFGGKHRTVIDRLAAAATATGARKTHQRRGPAQQEHRSRQHRPSIEFFAAVIQTESPPPALSATVLGSGFAMRATRQIPGRVENGLHERQGIAAPGNGGGLARWRSRQPPAAAGRTRWVRRKAFRT
jgi:hypothetical protein